MLLVLRSPLLDVSFIDPFSAVGGFSVNTNKFVIPKNNLRKLVRIFKILYRLFIY